MNPRYSKAEAGVVVGRIGRKYAMFLREKIVYVLDRVDRRGTVGFSDVCTHDEWRVGPLVNFSKWRPLHENEFKNPCYDTWFERKR